MLISVNDSPSTPCTSTNATVVRPDLRAAGATFPRSNEILDLREITVPLHSTPAA